MGRRRIGRTALEIEPLVLGTNVFGWTADQPTSHAILDTFTDRGFNAIDTADVYTGWIPGNCGGESEAIIGEWLASPSNRDRVVIASKVGADTLGRPGISLKARHIIESVEQSLRRLRTDYIDLYQAHGVDTLTPLEETFNAFERLVRSGKVRAVGASNHDLDQLQIAIQESKARGSIRYECIQPRYNLCQREGFEGELQDFCVREQLGVFCYSALAKGFLTGKFRSEAQFAKSQWGDKLQVLASTGGAGLLSMIEQVSLAHDTTMAAVSIAWVMEQPGVTAPIVACNSVTELKQVLECAALRLSSAELTMLTNAAGATGVP